MAEHKYNSPKNTIADTGIISALAADAYLHNSEELDRLTVQILPGGQIAFKGTRACIEEFFRMCAQEGLDLRVEYISFYERQDRATQSQH